MESNEAGDPDQGGPMEPDYSIGMEGTDAGWVVQARWFGNVGDVPSEGPREVLLRLSDDASPEVRQRGLNSGVMRRLERLVGQMTATIHEKPSVSSVSDVARAYVAEQVAGMPPGPRDDPDAYYAGLLKVFQGLIDMGYPQPVNLLSSVMGVPKDTLKTRLRKARLQRKRA